MKMWVLSNEQKTWNQTTKNTYRVDEMMASPLENQSHPPNGRCEWCRRANEERKNGKKQQQQQHPAHHRHYYMPAIYVTSIRLHFVFSNLKLMERWCSLSLYCVLHGEQCILCTLNDRCSFSRFGLFHQHPTGSSTHRSHPPFAQPLAALLLSGCLFHSVRMESKMRVRVSEWVSERESLSICVIDA